MKGSGIEEGDELSAVSDQPSAVGFAFAGRCRSGLRRRAADRWLLKADR